MSRRIQLSTTPELSARILGRLEGMAGIASVSLQAGASVHPPGDVLTIDATNEAARAILKLLDELDAFEGGCVTLGEPTAVIAPRHHAVLSRQGNEAAWEDVAEQLRRDTNVTVNYLLLMTVAGAIACFGVVAGTLHIVVGAMLIAPGFEPVLRIAFGALGRRHGAREGLRSVVAGYLALAAGAAAALPLALLLEGRTAEELPELHWAAYWSSLQASGVVVSLFAGAAGATIMSGRLTVFATGVMVALALVPSMALVGMGLASGNLALALGGLLRWGTEVCCVLVAGGAVLALKRRILHHRRVFD